MGQVMKIKKNTSMKARVNHDDHDNDDCDEHHDSDVKMTMTTQATSQCMGKGQRELNQF